MHQSLSNTTPCKQTVGFHDDFDEWNMARHDIFGPRFRQLLISDKNEIVDDFEVQEKEIDDVFGLDED